MRRVLVDRAGQPVYPSAALTYRVDHMEYRVADDGNPEGDVLIIHIDETVMAGYTPLSQFPVTSVR